MQPSGLAEERASKCNFSKAMCLIKLGYVKVIKTVPIESHPEL